MSSHNHEREIRRGEDLFKAGQFAASLETFKSVLQKDPHNVGALNDAGLASEAVGDSVRAVEYFESALAVDPSSTIAFYNLIDLLSREEATDLAVEVYEKYHSFMPETEERREYASALSKLRRPRTATSADELSVVARAEGVRRKHLVIVAQPQSGTANLWQALRQDPRLLCFNEPFRPYLRSFLEAGSDDQNETIGPYLEREELVKQHWSTILPYEEFYPDFVGHQEEYLRTLLGESRNVCIDVVQCSGKIDALRRLAPDALIVHLVRDPRSWVTSHLQPHGEWMSALPERFFSYEESFDAWSRQKAAHAINAQGYAHEQLLQVWDHFVERAERAATDLTIRYEHFAIDPEGVLRVVYEGLELDYTHLNLSAIAEPAAPFEASDPRWEDALNRYVSTANHRFLFDYDSIPSVAA